MENKQRILVSACLLGIACRYDGQSKADKRVMQMIGQAVLIPVCPEQLGGLPTPRPPAERIAERVCTVDGQDVTRQYQKGAQQAAYLAQLYGCKHAVLKQKSPSCGSKYIYDGSFSKKLLHAEGVTAQLLSRQGVKIWDESEVVALQDYLEGKNERKKELKISAADVQNDNEAGFADG